MILTVAGTAPTRVTAMGQAAVQPQICDVAMVGVEFESGFKAHLFCSWLNPYKEHLFAIVGDMAMAVFDDTADNWDDKLMVYPHKVAWKGHIPEFIKGTGERVIVARGEPLRNEMEHFLECVGSGKPSRTGPEEAIAVLRVLAAAQQSMDTGEPVQLENGDVG
jgi:UDP-2-acetamido-3-amino-2,3-dideoxy-glucuronate N-acetyltransferase